jgi:hypothetical protein
MCQQKPVFRNYNKIRYFVEFLEEVSLMRIIKNLPGNSAIDSSVIGLT